MASRWKLWAGLILVLIALLPAIGFILSPSLVFTGPILVLIAFFGGFLLRDTGHMAHGTMLWVGLILFLIAILPSIGIILLPALVFTGPILVLVAVAGGYLIASPHHR